MADQLKYNVGDPVHVVADNYGNDAVIVAVRDMPGSHYQVSHPSGNPFWAMDHEVGDPLPYDSKLDTLMHIEQVRKLLRVVQDRLALRAAVHDQSKLEAPEKPVFDEMTPRLRGLTYGSDEYHACLAEMRSALQYHYAHNSHHPEHYGESGINGMSLLDLIEMIADWKAAGMRHADGNFSESLRINRERFGISDQLAAIFENTRRELDW